ncbi:terminase small subunit [Candidatus Accumulibacter vicinus]|uniref:Terminase small subunit n=1 Tax=Candidatus Accumulibacter vicinus TaxID=2954382 RepID=A0A084Y3I9_9PROT|nr:terminase small subunit [Candidatus Accumulibacter vicinus]KFB69283.1 MAG: Terminase small subunit [Candidatus Accumulibacter vicinus]
MNIAACPAEVSRGRVIAEQQYGFVDGGKLTARQEKFVEHCALSGNATEAARLAGYAEKSAKVMACRLTKDNRIAARIASRRAENAAKFEITKEEVIAGILSAIEMALEQQNPAAMISGLVQIGKLCGFYEPEVRRIELSGSAERLQAKFAAMSDDELLELAARSSHRGLI